MAKQTTFGDLELAGQRRTTRRAAFLEQMDAIVPWAEWTALIKPFYYEPGGRGRPARDLEQMLRMYLLQCWFDLSDEGCEDAVLDSRAMQRFVGVDLMGEQVPDATTLLKFRRILEDNGLQEAMFARLNGLLDEAGVMMRGGSIVDATFIESPSSTKNARKERDPEARQGKKGKNWHFGYKAHVGADAGSGLVHTVALTPANVSDLAMAHALVRTDDSFCYGDSGYTGVAKRPEVAGDEALSAIDWIVARRPSSIKTLGAVGDFERGIESRKASVRAKVELPFLVVKRQFGWAKTRYRGIAKNYARACMSFALANIALVARAGRSLDPPPSAARA